MKTSHKIFAVLILLVTAVTFKSCVKGDFDEPPLFIPKVDFPSNKSIAELKDWYLQLKSQTPGLKLVEITEDYVIQGVIVANDESGNLYKKFIIQDETGGIELTMDKTNLHNLYKVGQRIFVKCKGMYIGDYNNLIQLGYKNENDIGWLPELYISRHIFPDSLPGAKPEPLVVTLNALNSTLISTLVKFENVSFTEPGVMWAPDVANATNRYLVGAPTFAVRTSRFANFASEPVPAGYGDITGILSIFGTTYQLTIRDINDIGEFDGEQPPPPGGGDGTKANPYTVGQAVQLQNATPQVVGWVKGYIVGAVKSGVTSVTSANDIDFTAPFSSATNVLIAHDKNETNYMNCVVVNLPSGTSLRSDVNLQNNPTNLGKWLNVKGTLRTYFGLAGLRDFSGEPGDFEFEGGNGTGPGTGSGTQADPYNVATAIEKQNATPYVVGWVKGYIIGTVKPEPNTVNSSADLQFVGPFTRDTHVLIADDVNETDHTKILAVNLPIGKPLRTQVNLVDNPQNLGKWLNVNGTLRTYFGIAGSRDSSGESTEFELETGGGGGGSTIFLEEFTSTLGAFSAYSVSGAQVWGWANFDGGCAVMSGFVSGTSFANEDWLISPAISLAGHTGVTMNFREAINFITSINDLKVFVSTNYDGSSNPATQGTWNELTGFTRAAGNSWNFINSGDVSLAAYEGQTIRIAFRYMSTNTASSTWEISRVEVKK